MRGEMEEEREKKIESGKEECKEAGENIKKRKKKEGRNRKEGCIEESKKNNEWGGWKRKKEKVGRKEVKMKVRKNE